MNKRDFVTKVMRPLLVVSALCLGVGQGFTQSQSPVQPTNGGAGAIPPCRTMRCVTMAQRKSAAASAAQRRLTQGPTAPSLQRGTRSMAARPMMSGPQAPTALTMDQLYFGTHPNYANSPLPALTINSTTGAVSGVTPGTGLRKFVDKLPGLPVAKADTITFPGSDYYEIALLQYQQVMHSDLPATTLRGYVQLNKGTDSSGANTIAPPTTPQYLGPLIIAQRDRPVRVKFTNMLPPGSGGDLFIPVDTTVMGAGMNMNNGAPYQQNRATLHLHGGNTPWISDGTPHQWTVPQGDAAAVNQKGDSVQYVPDMFFDSTGKVVAVPPCSATLTTACWPQAVPAGLTNNPGQGSLTFYYTNQQSARLMFYHDHSYGTTRLNVYAGEAGAYLLQDPIETQLIATGVIPATEIPLVIQDKTFVPANPVTAPIYSVAVLAPGTNYNQATTSVSFSGGTCTTFPTAFATVGVTTDGFGTVLNGAILAITLTNAGSCSVPPDVTITDSGAIPGTGAAAFASLATLAQQDPTWSWGTGKTAGPNGNGDLWFPHTYMTNQWPDNPDGSSMNPMGRWDYGMWFWPPMTMSAPGLGGLVHGAVDCITRTTPVVTACPGFPSPLLPATDPMGMGSIASLTPESFMDTPIVNGVAYPTVTVPAGAVRFRILNAGNDRSLNLSLFAADPTVTTVDGRSNTEIKMVTAAPTVGWPVYWPTDGRDGGVPDPATSGPSWIQIGNEAGFIPNPVVIPPTPVGYEYARRSITVTNVADKSLFLGPAERADVIVDFSAFAGKTLILYNDAPAPVPAFDPRYDYYTGDSDMTGMGGAPTTLAGFGPNTRTVMQIQVSSAAGTPANLAGLQAQLPAAFMVDQPAPLVPESAYSSIYGQNFPNTFPRLQDYQTTFTPYGATAPLTLTLLDKTIQELFELNYGRMNATLGTELPLTNYTTQTTIPLGYVDPPTEVLTDSKAVSSQPVGVLGDGTQIWKITHNGVDTHAIHFHLFNVQLINRIGWDGTNRPPDPNELGWKETVRMNPLEIEFVALRPMAMNLPWPIPDSVRLIDVTMPAGKDTAMGLESPAGIPATQINSKINFGWEYVWHCHLLGHEENDMMRPMLLQVAPEAPTNLRADGTTQAPNVIITWTDQSASETGFVVERDTDPLFLNPAPTVLQSAAQAGWGTTVTTTDPSPGTATVFYRVKAVNDSAYPIPPVTSLTLSSTWSNIASIGLIPAVTITPSALAFPNQVVGLNSTSPAVVGAAQAVTVTNAGPGTLIFVGMAFTGLNPADFAQTSTCGSTLAPASSCTINVMFAPTVVGARAGSLVLTTNDPLNTQPSVALSGTGIAPMMVLTPTALSFGNQPLKTTSATPLTVTVSNSSGTAPLVINSIGIGGTNAAEFAFTQTCGTTFPATLATGASCSISLSFTPAVAGARSAILNINAAGPAISQSVALSGTGTIPNVSLAPSSLIFANQVVNLASAAQAVTLTNTGLAPLSITGMSITGVNAADFANSTTCGATLAAGANCTISIAFKPLARGLRIASLVVTDSAPGGTQSASLSGTGIAPIASILPVPLMFGIQVIATTSAPQTLILSNSGDAPLLIGGIMIGGANVTDFALVANNCGVLLPAQTSCTLDVTVTPTLAGLRNALFIVSSSDPINPVISVPLSAVGTALALSPTALSFGSQTVGTSSTSRTVTLTNAGTIAMTINSIALAGLNPTDYTMNNGCGNTLRAGRSCTVSLRFRPAATGTSSASLVVNTSDPGVPVASVTLTGTALAPALSTSPATLTFSSSLNTPSPAQQVTVSNVGTAPLTINGFALAGTDIGQFIENNNCPMGTALAVGANCTIDVTFHPTTATPLSKSQTLNINVAAPATSQSIALTGTVIIPTYSVSPAAIVFANQAIRTISPGQILTITNTGTVSLTLSNVNLSGTGANQFAQTSNCGTSVFRPFPATLVAGASCNVTVTFRPRTAVTSTATLGLSVGGGAAPAQTLVPLSGTGQ